GRPPPLHTSYRPEPRRQVQVPSTLNKKSREPWPTGSCRLDSDVVSERRGGRVPGRRRRLAGARLQVGGGPGAEAGEPEAAEDGAVRVREEEGLGEWVLATPGRLECCDPLVRDARQLGAGDRVLVLFDPLLDPLPVESAKRGGRG